MSLMGEPAKEPVQRGRYAVYEGDGGFIIAYARNICPQCAAHDCGEQADAPLDFTRKGVMNTILRGRKMLAESGMKLPMMTMGGDGGPRRGR